jgi:hypothetical protein
MENQTNNPKLPNLEPLFFAVCRTAIKNTAWKYSDFEKVKFVEGQLDALEIFFNDLREIQKSQPSTSEPSVEVELPTTTPENINPMPSADAFSPEVDKDVKTEEKPQGEPSVASNQEPAIEQEKKN